MHGELNGGEQRDLQKSCTSPPSSPLIRPNFGMMPDFDPKARARADTKSSMAEPEKHSSSRLSMRADVKGEPHPSVSASGTLSP